METRPSNIMVKPNQTPNHVKIKIKSVGKVVTYVLKMIIRWVNTWSLSTKFEWVSWTYTTLCCNNILKSIIKRLNCILHTASTGYTQQALLIPVDLSPHVFYACDHFCMVMERRRSNMPKTGYDRTAIMYHAYGTHHELRRICGNNLTGYSSENAYLVYIVNSITPDLWLKVPEYQ